MSMFSNLIGRVQRYAQQNPDKVRKVTDKTAQLADRQTKGKYRNQIASAARKIDGMTGSGPTKPRRDEVPDPHRNDPGYSKDTDPRTN